MKGFLSTVFALLSAYAILIIACIVFAVLIVFVLPNVPALNIVVKIWNYLEPGLAIIGVISLIRVATKH